MCLAGEGGGKGHFKMWRGVQLTTLELAAGEFLNAPGNGLGLGLYKPKFEVFFVSEFTTIGSIPSRILDFCN